MERQRDVLKREGLKVAWSKGGPPKPRLSLDFFGVKCMPTLFAFCFVVLNNIQWR